METVAATTQFIDITQDSDITMLLKQLHITDTVCLIWTTVGF